MYAHLRPVLVRCTCTYTRGARAKFRRPAAEEAMVLRRQKNRTKRGGEKNKRQTAPRVRRRGRQYDESGDGVRESAAARTCAFPSKGGLADGGAGARAAERSSPTAASAHRTDGPAAAAAAAAAACSLGLRTHGVLARAHAARTAFASSASRVVRRSRPFPARPSYHISPDADSLRSSRFACGFIRGTDSCRPA